MAAAETVITRASSVTLEAWNEAMVTELAAKYQLYPNQIYAWKKQLGKQASREVELSELYAKIGQPTAEVLVLSRVLVRREGAGRGPPPAEKLRN